MKVKRRLEPEWQLIKSGLGTDMDIRIVGTYSRKEHIFLNEIEPIKEVVNYD